MKKGNYGKKRYTICKMQPCFAFLDLENEILIFVFRDSWFVIFSVNRAGGPHPLYERPIIKSLNLIGGQFWTI